MRKNVGRGRHQGQLACREGSRLARRMSLGVQSGRARDRPGGTAAPVPGRPAGRPRDLEPAGERGAALAIAARPKGRPRSARQRAREPADLQGRISPNGAGNRVTFSSASFRPAARSSARNGAEPLPPMRGNIESRVGRHPEMGRDLSVWGPNLEDQYQRPQLPGH
jgi:hypothetical protein